MARRVTPKVNEKTGVICVLAALALTLAAPAQTRLTLQQATSRAAPDWTPAYEGQEVVVNGQVSFRPVRVSDSYYLPIQDQAFYGLLLQGSAQQLQAFDPGDWLEAQGTIVKRGGLPILVPREITRLSRTSPPAPRTLKPAELASFRYLGVLVTTESAVLSTGENAGGDLVSIGERDRSLSVFLPRLRRDTGPQLSGFHAGDRIRVTGLANQYCTLPPYDRFFQVLIPSPASVMLLERAWMIPPPLLLASVLFAAALLAIWWIRERRMAALRRQMRFLNALGEEVIGAPSPAEILSRLTLTLPQLANASAIGIYIHNRGAKTLESIHSTGVSVETVDLDAPNPGISSGLASAFRNRSLIAIPDTRRSPFFHKEEPGTPRSVIFVPMFAQSELVGVLELHHAENFHYFSVAEQAAMQHLANQVAAALKLQEQQSIREQLFRSEKLAAAGQLISDVANELRSPLESIARMASTIETKQPGASTRELQSIAGEARRASEVVARLVSFTKVEQREAQPVDLNAILTGLLKFRAPEWKSKGVEVRAKLAPKRATVMGSPGQLEQVLLNLLVDAEKSAAEARERTILVSSSLLAKRVLIEISYPTRASDYPKPEPAEGDRSGSGALAMGVCRGIIQSHGGDFRLVRASSTQARYDVELPLVESRGNGLPANSEMRGASRQLTVLVVEPDTKVQRQLVQSLGNRGDRVVPISSAEEGADLVQRLRFDMAICAVRLPGLNWVEFFERVRHQIGGFVLLTDGFDTDLARAFQDSEGFVLSKPLDEAELHRVCRALEERALVAR